MYYHEPNFHISGDLIFFGFGLSSRGSKSGIFLNGYNRSTYAAGPDGS